MAINAAIADTHQAPTRLRSVLSRVALGLAWLTIAAVYLLMSPPNAPEYPGAIPWAKGSILKALIDIFSFDGAVQTARGVEIKDFAFHLATSAALALLAARALLSGRLPADRKTAKGAWFAAQALLAAWVLMSAVSAYWSRDAALSLGQAALYGIMLAWAVSLGWTLESRDLPRLLGGFVALSAIASIFCIWYYHERLPTHRPGFPLGNPSVLASCVFPALLIGGALLLAELSRRRSGASPRWARVALLAAALVPLIWCFQLTGSRGAWMGMLGGVFGVVFLHANRRQRWWVGSSLLLVAAIALWFYSANTQDLAMARGATIRFRMYAWSYAAMLWWQRPITGSGAGAFPRLAGALSARDRALDPAAFMGDLLEHAHNELFEVLTEIGLIGGLTFVAGHVALLSGAAGLLRVNHSPQRRWVLLGLVAAICGMLADAMFGVGLRLPGAPAVYFTLVGALWSACRAVSKITVDEAGFNAWRQRMRTRRSLLAIGSLMAAGLVGWLALRNWQGALSEQRSVAAMTAGAPEDALKADIDAEETLLDPVRVLLARDRMTRCLLEMARGAAGELSSASASGQPTTQSGFDRRNAISLAEQAFTAAVAASQNSPGLVWLPGSAAKAAELLDALNRDENPLAAQQWWATALQAWRSQRNLRPNDVEALLALTRYPTPIGDYIGLLREALRGEAILGEMRSAAWDEAFARGAAAPGFAEVMNAILQSVGPYTPQTDVDNLMLTHAPEMYRLSAVWKATHGDFGGAASDAEQASGLYAPLRTRMPNAVSVALAEEAAYLLQSAPDAAARAGEVAERAIRDLPPIQPDQRDRLAKPFRLLFAKARLGAGDEATAREELRLTGVAQEQIAPRLAALYVDLAQYFVRNADDATIVRKWLDAAVALEPRMTPAWAWLVWLDARDSGAAAADARLQAAGRAGLSANVVEQIRGSLRKEFPKLEYGAGDQQEP